MRVFESFLTSFRLKNTYKVNTVIYSLKSIPLVNRLLPDSLYTSRGLKAFGGVVSALFELGSVFLGKALYLLVMVYAVLGLMKSPGADAFVHIFFFLTIAGGLMNTHIFNPTKDKYYAMFLLRMDARKYTLGNYLYFLLKMAAGFLPFTLWIGGLCGVRLASCLLMPLFVCGVKLIVTAVSLYGSRDGSKVTNENLPSPVMWTGIALATAAAYAPPYFGYAVNETTFLLAAAAVVVAGVPCLIYILTFDQYRSIYRELLKPGNFAMNNVKATQAAQETYRKKIVADISQTSTKAGYRYFNELFMKRHSRLMTKSAKKITVFLILAFAASAIACVYVPEAARVINSMTLRYLPYFLFVMYMVNRGRAITQAMFLNCDHSMLAYRFYRQPKAILALFADRLGYIVMINLMPAAVIAIGLPLLLYLSGGTPQPVHYAVLFVSILAMSVFFSVHTLALYYLLQPYNVEMESKNATYGILNSATYFVCYFFMGREIPALSFGVGVSVFCIAYTAAALLLVYRLAPKTFRLRG